MGSKTMWSTNLKKVLITSIIHKSCSNMKYVLKQWVYIPLLLPHFTH